MTDAPSRRQVIKLLGAGSIAGLAGCSGGGDGGGTDDGANGDDETPTETATASPTSTTTTAGSSGGLSSEVPELTIVSAEQDVAEETDPSPAGIWIVHLEVRNTGNQETDVFEYSYEGAVYDSDGNDIGRIGGKSSGPDSVAPPGETGSITLTARDVEPDNVASFDVTILCDVLAEGVYC